MTAIHASARARLSRPRSPRPAVILGATAFILVGSYALSGLRPSTVPPDGRALPVLPIAGQERSTAIDPGSAEAPQVSFARLDHSIEAWTKNLTANPKDFLAATNLAILYQGRGRLSYDLADHERGLTAARTALTIEPTYAPARAVEAAILLTLHDFDGAYRAADSLLRDDPSQSGALATRFDAELELGRIDAARSDLKALASAGGPGVMIREARLESVTGDHAAALASATKARAAAIDEDASDLGFYEYAVGEYARLAGDADTARSAYRAALNVRDTDVGALMGLARIDAFDGQIDAAIDGLNQATAIAPQPEAMGLLGDLQATVGDKGSAKSYETVRFIERLGDIQSTAFDRQLLRFELDHDGATDQLLDRARASVAGRPDWTGHDAVAWALYRLGRYDEASVEIDAARTLGADDARLRWHAGAIAIARGDRSSGRAMVESALDLGPALDPIERSEAIALLAR